MPHYRGEEDGNLSNNNEEVKHLQEENDALKTQFRSIGIVPYLDRMKELAEARDKAVAELKALHEQYAIQTRIDGERIHVLENHPNQKSCEFCGDVTEVMFLRARCHPTAPLMVRKEGSLLILSCYLPECGREIARFHLSIEE